MAWWQLFGRRRAPAAAESFRHLEPGKRYRVTRPFRDFDGIEHPAGACWTFTRSTFLPYEDGRTLFVVSPDGSGRQIRCQLFRPPGTGPDTARDDSAVYVLGS